MNLHVINSSSKGNSYILTSASGKLILDAGVSLKSVQKALNFDFNCVQGCLITHIHSDHISSCFDLMRYGLDCYMSMGTAMEYTGGKIMQHRINIVKAHERVNIGGFDVLPFELEHDVENYGYLIWDHATGEQLLYITDTFYCKYNFRNVNYIMVECNYCKDILQHNVDAGYLPEALYKRLLKSHFELEHVKQFLQASDLSQCRKIVLCHLSDGNSDAARMQLEIQECTGIDTVVAEAGKRN